MSIKQYFTATINIFGDNTNTMFSFDLESGPYVLSDGANTFNWFSTEKKGTAPTSVNVTAPAGASATLTGTVVTVTFSTPPPAAPTTTPVTLQLVL